MAMRVLSRRILQLSYYRRFIPIVSSNSRLLISGTSSSMKILSLKYVERQFSSNTSQQAEDPTKIASYEEVKDLPNHKEKLLIDVREPNELVETGSIPTSINIPLKTVSENLALSEKSFLDKFNRQKPRPQTEIIFTCRSGVRAGNACEMANQLGFKNVKNYKGSWIDWAQREGIDK